MRVHKAVVLLFVLAAIAWAFGQVRAPNFALEARDGPAIGSARRWGYQLQLAAPERVAADIDLMVVDYARGAVPSEALSRTDVRRFQTRPDGSRRIVLAYLSIGEAESYRYYWQAQWRQRPPAWLAHENKEWRDNFHVRYWQRGWTDIIFRPTLSTLDRIIQRFDPTHIPYIDRIIEAGFDGVYLDRVDAFYEWETTRTSAEADMVDFVVALATYARSRRPGFLIVPQNGEELLADVRYRATIDAVAKEDLFYGIDGAERENKADDVVRSVRLLDLAKASALPVFVVEYLRSPELRSAAQRRADGLAYRLHFAERQLSQAPEIQLAPRDPALRTSRQPEIAPPPAKPRRE